MRFVGFVGPSYTLNTVNVDCQRCVNLYPEINELGSGHEKEVASLVSTPGLNLGAAIGAGPIRCVYTASNGQLFVVSGNTVYKVASNYSTTTIATLTTSTGQVSMADSGFHLAIVDGSTTGYFWTLATNTLTAIPFPTDINDITFAGTDQVTYQDGYFIFNHHGTGVFFITGLAGSSVADETTIDALDFREADGSPDELIAVMSDHRDLWLFGATTTEVYFDSGNSDFPFERISGAYVEQGCAARFSVAKLANTVFWLGQDDKGSGMVFQAVGYQPKRISTHAVEQAIQSYSTISDAVSYAYQDRGHMFYVLNFPTANATWVFDVTTSLWHERAYNNNGQLERHRGICHGFAFGKHLLGDYENGNLYELSHTVYTDNGAAITRMRVSPHVTQDMVRMFYSAFQLDIESGTGIDGSGQGVDPQAMLQFSDDGGHTWSNEKWTSIGKIGQTKARAIWRRLGIARDRVFKIVITDPVKVAILGAELDAAAGGN